MKLLILTLLLTSMPAVLTADTPSFVGAWAVHSRFPGHEIYMQCTFAPKGNDLAGSCKGDAGTYPLTGKIDGNKATWEFTADYDGQSLTAVYTGTLDASARIIGTVDVQPAGYDGEFTATPAK
jgi:hypothetical protein